MSPSGYMKLGAFVGCSIFIIDLMSNPVAVSFAAFCGGALFGKGYGLYEERDDIRRKD